MVVLTFHMFEMSLVCLNCKLSTLWFLVGPSTYRVDLFVDSRS